MGKQEKVISTVLRGTSDANISFDDTRSLLLYLGFDERIRGSHHVYRKQGIEEKINIQSSGGKMKPYQVKQIREIILKYRLADK